MRPAHTVESIRAAEEALMATLPAGALMERAAVGLATACGRALGRAYGARVCVLAGTGNNAGDALIAGALLARRGAQVEAVLIDRDRVHEIGLRRLLAAGGRVSEDPVRSVVGATLTLDGVLGIGGRPGVRGEAADLLDLAADSAGLLVAVDLPSGVNADTGETPARHARADLTVTFGVHKVAGVVDPAAAACGEVRLVDIALRPYLGPAEIEVLDDADVSVALPRAGRDAHKYSRGVVGVVAGSGKFTGAGVLSVGGAVRGGAGMVRHLGDEQVAAAVRSAWPEVVAGPGQVQAWAVGPGVGTDPGDGGYAVRWTLGQAAGAEPPVPVLVDADGLRHLADALAQVGSVEQRPALVLTPHAGELARLLGVERNDVESRRIEHAQAAARRYDAVVLLKGSTTVVADPGGRLRVNGTGTPALATAGTGDVLTGLVGALLAAGLEPFEAASVGAHVHGRAGRYAGTRAGYPSASDVLDALPVALVGLRRPL